MNWLNVVLQCRTQPVRRCLFVAGLGWLLGAEAACGQNTRLIDRNTIGWFTNATTLQWADRWSAHLEFQARRDEFVAQGQQNLFRTGINYQVSDKLTCGSATPSSKRFRTASTPFRRPAGCFPNTGFTRWRCSATHWDALTLATGLCSNNAGSAGI